MTNKKFKIAAMSMALTACVAAQPLLANAAENADTAPSNNEPEQTESTPSSTSAGTDTAPVSEPEVNQEEGTGLGVLGDKDVTVDYDHTKDTTTDGPDGSTTDSTGTVNREVPKETPPAEQPPAGNEQQPDADKNVEQGGTEGGQTDAGKGSETELPPSDTEKKPIGSANKSETVKKETDVVLGETTTKIEATTNPDGSTTTDTTTTTNATLETTTTVTGEASAKTDETTTENVTDSLDNELGGKKGDLSWDTAEGTKFGDYTVSDVGPEKDGKKEFTLTKEDEVEHGKMSGEEIAKLIEADGYTPNEDGTYTLTKEYVDSNGQKQTTTIKVDPASNTVTKTTSTTLTITLESQHHDDGNEDFGSKENTDYPYPSTDITVKDNNGKDHTFDLKDILDKAKANKDGTFIYEDKDNNLTYTITRKEGSEDLSGLTDSELKKLLNDHAGSEKYTLDNEGNLCYITDKGEKCRVSDAQNALLRNSLSLDVSITDHHGKESGSKADGFDSVEEAKADAEKRAQDEALKKALAEAIHQETGKTLTENDITLPKVRDGKFEWTDTTTGKTYTFRYTEKGTVSGSEKINDPTTVDPNASSAEKNTETGSAEVSGSTVIWTEKGKTYTDTTVKETFGDGYDFTKETEDKLALKGSAEYNKDGRLTKLITEDGKTYTFKYSEGSAPDGLGTISGEQFKKVEWTVTEKTKEVEKEEAVDVGTISISDKSYTKNADGTYDFTIKGEPYTGLTKNEDGTYSKTTEDGTTLIITVTPSKTAPDMKAALEGKGYTDVIVKDDGTVSYKDKDGVQYKGTYSASAEDITLKKYKKMDEPLTGNGSSKEEAKKDLFTKIQKELAELGDGESLLFDGKYEFTKETSESEIKEIISKVVNCAVDFDKLDPKALQKMLEEQKAEADAAGKSYTGTHADYYYKKSDGTKVDKYDGHLWWDGNGNVYYLTEKEDWRPDYPGYGPGHGGGWKDRYNFELVTLVQTEDDYIEHLDLATDSNLTLAEKNQDGSSKTTDCVLINKKLEWNEDAGKLIQGEGNTVVGLGKRITYDDENDKDPTTGHYEFARATWDNQYGPPYGDPDAKDNNPDRSVYYKLTGTVAYGQVGDTYTAQKNWLSGEYDYVSARKAAERALKKYKENYTGNLDDLKNAQVVEICADQTPYGKRSYKIYLYTSSLTAYGYLSDYSNVCGNAHYNAQDPNDYVGGYDLRIDDLTQINEEHVTAHGKSDYYCTGTLSRLTKKLDDISNDLGLTPTHKTVTIYEDQVTGTGSGLFGSYDRHMTEEHDYTSPDNDYHVISADSTAEYTTYKTWEDTTAHWSDALETITGAFKFNYTSTKDAKVAKATKETHVRTKSSVKYHYSYVEHEELDPITETTTVTTPGGGGEEENGLDAPVLPSIPELPPVQDARPDAPVLPSDPVLPAEPALPAVQDAHALPQTGVNWLAAIGLALSGMTLMITGAFATLTGKSKKGQQ